MTAGSAPKGHHLPVTAVCRSFLDHYRTWPRENDVIPGKQAFRPAAVPALLPHLLVLQPSLPGVITIRLLSAGIAGLVRYDSTGRNYLTALDDRARPMLVEWYRRAIAAPCGILAPVSLVLENGLVLFRESLTLPLRAPDGDTWFMSCVDESGDHPPPDLMPTAFVDIGSGIPDPPPAPRSGWVITEPQQAPR